MTRSGTDVGDTALLDIADYVASLRALESMDGEVLVAVVHVDGAILAGKSREDLSSGRVAGAETIAEALAWAEEEPSVDAVVLRVSSPGGSRLRLGHDLASGGAGARGETAGGLFRRYGGVRRLLGLDGGAPGGCGTPHRHGLDRRLRG